LRTSQLFDCVIQQIDRIRSVDIRPTAILIFFDKRYRISCLSPSSVPTAAPQSLFNLAKRFGVIFIVSDGVNFHAKHAKPSQKTAGK